ncbi:hypothetical protein [Nocardia sp. NPDC003963]
MEAMVAECLGPLLTSRSKIAAERACAAMAAVADVRGEVVPDAVARMAASPELLNGFLAMMARLDQYTLDPIRPGSEDHDGTQRLSYLHRSAARKLRRLGAAFGNHLVPTALGVTG